MSDLLRGDLLPEIVTLPPGPRARELSRRLASFEAPGINTLFGGEPNVHWQEALGSNVLDVDGNRYVDFTSGFGVAAIGHRHPAVVEAVRRQSSLLVHGLGDAAGHPSRVELAERLIRSSPIEDAQVYYAISGADAVEVAIKTAVLATGRKRLLTFDPAYHGLTLGALAATSRPGFRHPFESHLHPHVHRLPFGCDLRLLEDELRSHAPFAAVLVEPIVGREGILMPPEGWLSELARICHSQETPWIADEIFTGFGRTGRLFAVEHEGAVPDLLCCGKALAGGLPLAAVIGRRSLMAAWVTPGEALHTATFVANPIACAAGLATLEVLGNQRLVARARKLGEGLAERLDLWRSFDGVHDIRGRGLLWGLELESQSAAARFARRARDRGVLLLAGGPEGKVAQLVPPLTIDERQLAGALTILEELLRHPGRVA